MDSVYLAAICAVVPGLGRAKLPNLLALLGSAKNVFFAKYETLVDTKIITPAKAKQFVNNRDLNLPEKIESFCRREGVHLLTIFDSDYPTALRNMHDSPLVLYVKGILPKAMYSLAIVGSRSATAYGLRAAEYFSTSLSRSGITIISGGARGIDTIAHQACLNAGGNTVAVLGCGLDQIYPPENNALFRQISENGALISEFAPGTLPLPKNFPARNRIIAGLSQAVLVVEAAKRSGAIITANIAIDEGRDVFCVPGNIFSSTSMGCHDLIRTGAKLVDTPQDIVDEIKNWNLTENTYRNQLNIFEYSDQTSAEPVSVVTTKLGKEILDLLDSDSMSIEEITQQSNAAFSEISVELLDLQVAGLIDIDNANKYYRR